MKLTFIFVLLGLMSFASVTYSQSTKLTFELKNATLESVFKQIEDLSEFKFAYNSTRLDVNKKISLKIDNQTIDNVLETILGSANFKYQIVDRYIIITDETDQNPLGLENSQQLLTITGKVTDASANPIPGVSVVVKGTTVGSITDSNGMFSLANVPENAILQFSFVGMKGQEIAVSGKSVINATLEEDAIGIEEVVAIGYGVMQKKLITGATSQVDGAEIQKRNTTTVLDALKGSLSGVSITKISAQPGDGFKVNIRGLGTTGNSTPLYVVDGVTVSGINDLNPSDIESIDVLKDAASAAIYGSRASNGVILISTKKGKVGKATVSYDGYYGIQNVGKKMDFLGAKDYLTLMSEHYTNNNIAVPDFSKLIPAYAKIADGSWDGTNWLDATSNKNAPIQNHSINISGGTEQAVYSLGLSLDSQEGIVGKPAVPTNDRYTFRINTEYTLIKSKGFDILKVGENLNYSNTLRHVTIAEGSGNETSFTAVATGSPVIEIYNPDPTKQGQYPYFPFNVYGSPTGVAPTAPNPMAWLDYAKSGSFSRNNNLNGNIYMILQPVKGLSFRSSFGINSYSTSERSYVPAYLLSATAATSYFQNTMDRTAQAIQTGSKWIFDNTVNYKFTVKNLHNIDVLAGTSAERSGIGESLSGDNGNSLFNSFEFAYLINNKTVDPSFTHLSGSPLLNQRLMSYFGRASYDYKQTYMATAVIRADGSSNFAPGNRWGYFPSLSAGWAITNENFMGGTKGWLDYLKVRASWGENGNQSISPFQYLSTISFNGAPFYKFSDKTKFVNGGFPNILPNPDVSWETSVQTDIGFDARLLDNKLSLTFDWYKKQTQDWLVQAPILASDGTGAPYINGGDVENKGYEISASWNDQIGEFRYGITANFSYLKNEVTSIANPEGIIHGPGKTLHADQREVYRAQVGYPIGYFWGLHTDGLFQNPQEVLDYKNSTGKTIQPAAKPGDLRYVDGNDDGVIDQKDYTNLGDPNPNYIFGLSFNCSYKGFDLNAVTNGVAGNEVIWNYFNNNNHGTYNWSTSQMARWHGEGTSNTVPRINIGSTQDITMSDRFVADASYLRMSNLTLGYDFKTILKQIPLQQMRMYVSGQNLFTITTYEGFNPEVGSGGNFSGNWAGGVDSAPYPIARTFMIGVSIKY